VSNPQRKRLGEILLEAGLIDGTQLQAALGHQRRWGGRLGQALIDLKMASEEQIVSTLATKLGFERVPVEQVEYGPGLELALRLVPHEFAERNQLLPYAADTASLWVAMADPTNVGVIDELAFRTGRNVKLNIAGDREIARAIRRLYLGDKRGVEAIALDELDDGPVEMVGPLDPGYTRDLDAHFAPRDAPAPPAPTAPQGAPPPPMPARPEIAPSSPAARLAAAARGLRKVEPGAPSVLAAVPEAPPELIIEVPHDVEGETPFAPRVEAILDGLERIGGSEGSPPELARLARFASGMVRLLVRKRLITEDELATAFVQAERGAPKR
jgi:MshEN domain